MSPIKSIALDFDSDTTLHIACEYREKHVYPTLVGNNTVITDKAVLTNPSKASVEASLHDSGIAYITGVAHGAADSFPGNSDDQPVFATTIGGYNPQLIKGKIIHLLSCNSGDLLGRALADKDGGGASAFFGYSGNFTWPTNVDEKYANIFFNCDAQIDFALAQGKTAGEAFTLAAKEYQAQHDALVAEGSDASLQIASMLLTNLAMLCGPQVDNQYGSSGARVAQGTNEST